MSYEGHDPRRRAEDARHALRARARRGARRRRPGRRDRRVPASAPAGDLRDAAGRPRPLARAPGLAAPPGRALTARGRIVTTSSLSGFLLLYAIAGLRRFRRTSLRFAVENARIEAWLAEIARVAAPDPALAVEVAQCQRLVKGYSDTHERGWKSFGVLMDVVGRAGATLAPATLARAARRGARRRARRRRSSDAGPPRALA